MLILGWCFCLLLCLTSIYQKKKKSKCKKGGKLPEFHCFFFFFVCVCDGVCHQVKKSSLNIYNKQEYERPLSAFVLHTQAMALRKRAKRKKKRKIEQWF